MADNKTIQLPDRLFFAHVKALLAVGRTVQLRVQGESMRPLLRAGRDMVVLADYQAIRWPLRRGDIVLFRFGGQHILHRIAGIEGKRYTLAGDGNAGRTESCSREDIVAVVTHIIRPSGRSVACRSRRWRLASRGWLALPRPVKRLLLHIARRAGR